MGRRNINEFLKLVTHLVEVGYGVCEAVYFI